MIAAILGNGPSRESYFDCNIKYDKVVGCNVPWTDVDYTIILDEEVVERWKNEPELITCGAYFSEHAWRHIESPLKAESFFEQYKLGLVKPLPEYDTSGHVACSLLIKHGYSEIHVYGADSVWSQTLESRSHQFFKNHPDVNSNPHIKGWRNRWNKLVDDHPQIRVEFKR
jgi:hypothetical protein